MAGIDLDAVIGKIRAAAERGVRKAAEDVLTESNKHVPVETGDLEKSGKVTSDGLTSVISYNTGDLNPVIQHEDMYVKHDGGRTSKFLENAVNARCQAAAQTIADEIRAEIR